jgi:hypothetical protein
MAPAPHWQQAQAPVYTAALLLLFAATALDLP